MNLKYKVLWDKVLYYIKGNLTEQQYKTWFKPLAFESYDQSSQKLLLQVPSLFIYEYIEENYIDLLQKMITRVFGSGVVLTYRVVTDKKNNLTQDLQTDKGEDSFTSSKKATRTNELPNPLDVVDNEFDSQLEPTKTFNNYIEGDSNKLSRSIGLSIAKHPNSSQFNPMFIYGPSGSGKTHLINAIGLHIKKMYPQKRVLYISARLFQVQYTNSSRNGTINDFINFYQTIDVLIVDDIQEWMTATKTQNAFFHIFNHLFRNGKRIILASDRPPIKLEGMNDRLLTRFSCGLIAELEKPNVQLCIDILHSLIKRDGLNMPEDVIGYIAQTANGSVRELQGVVNSLLAFSVVHNSEIDLALAERVIKRTVKVDNEPLKIEEIRDKVCQHYNVTSDMISSKSRKQNIVLARQVSMFLAQKHIKLSACKIGKFLGGRDHSTVIHGCNQIEKRLKVDKSFTSELQTIEKMFMR